MSHKAIWHYTRLCHIDCRTREISKYCHVPARWGLQQTHPGLRAVTRHCLRDPLTILAITTYKKN